MTLSDRIRRWWAPAKWRDEHPEISEGEGFALSAEQSLADSAPKELAIQSPRDAIDLGRQH